MKPEKCQRCGAKAELFQFENQSVCESCLPPEIKRAYVRWSPKLQKEVEK